MHETRCSILLPFLLLSADAAATATGPIGRAVSELPTDATGTTPASWVWVATVILLSLFAVSRFSKSQRTGDAVFDKTDVKLGCAYVSCGDKRAVWFRHGPLQTAVSVVAIVVVASFVFRATDTRLWAAVVAFVSYWSRRYAQVLATHPVSTKSITTGVIQYIGDFGAQWAEQKLPACHHDIESGFGTVIGNGAAVADTVDGAPRLTQTSSETAARLVCYDRRRGLACAIDGLFVSGPIMHFVYKWMEYTIPVHEGNGSSFAALIHVLINDFFVDAFFVALLFVSTAVTEGCTHDLPRQLRQDLYPAVKASWASSVALFPVEFLCFRFLPLSFRVLSTNIIDLLWDAMISYMAHRSRRRIVTTGGTATIRRTTTKDK